MAKLRIKLKSGSIPDKRFNKRQLRMGVKIEKEHTNNPRIAKQIAKAHLKEFPSYYTALTKMEIRLKKKRKKHRRQ